ncbi:peroxiredoxin family protein [Planococcus shenhongbingii]|uniref:Redoxin domain-containing protein n=1 Tax=Planococcus shenhongbingii TaxID=3058398 RepID=A0ABT8N9L1_9BACL|nr:TlpA family protein disulfide reductase [Planococcus sp. N017]MDN7244433.1 redoxin domain-containing protein [Planococcus sp. N017]
MSKKLFGLLLIAAMIGIVIAGIVKNNIENTSEFDNIALGSDVEFLATDEGLAKGKVAPDFELTTLDGETVSLSDYQGKKVILNFWATWCPPCRAEMPHMQKYFEEQAKEENVEILAVNLTTEDRGIDKVKTFVREYDLTFPILMDLEGEIGASYQAVTIPTSYMIDTKGRVQNKIVGPMDETMIEKMVSNLE